MNKLWADLDKNRDGQLELSEFAQGVRLFCPELRSELRDGSSVSSLKSQNHDHIECSKSNKLKLKTLIKSGILCCVTTVIP